MHPSVHAAITPDKPAVIMAGSGQVVTYRALDDGSNRFAQLLRARGLRAGDHIAIMLENHPRFFELCWGAQRAGIIYTAMSTRLGADEIAYIVGDCGAKMFVTSIAQARSAAQVLPAIAGVAHRLMLDGTVDGYESCDARLAEQPAQRIADERAGGDMLYSSGTTGRPKGVFVPPETDVIDATSNLIELCRKVYRLRQETVYLSPAPLYHAAPLRFCMVVMRLGGTCVVMEHFDPQEYLRLVEKHRVTHTQLVPTMFVRMLKLPPEVRAQYDLSSLEVAIHAAAPCPIPIKDQMIAWWGPVLWEYYAGTEGNGMTMVGSADWLDHKGTVGKAVVGKLKICDDEGNELPAGEAGTIYFAEGKAFEYHNDPQQDRRVEASARLDHAGRRRLRRRGRLPLPHRPQGVHDHLRGREHLSPGSRERADHASEGRRRRGVRGAQRRVRRGGQGGGRAARHPRGRAGAGTRTDRVLSRAHFAHQVPAHDRLPGRAAAPPDRQALQAPAEGPLLGGPQDADRLIVRDDAHSGRGRVLDRLTRHLGRLRTVASSEATGARILSTRFAAPAAKD